MNQSDHVSDSAHFAKKADFEIVVTKNTGSKIIFERYVTKVRYRPTTGKLGSVQLVYDTITRTLGQNSQRAIRIPVRYCVTIKVSSKGSHDLLLITAC